MIKDGSTGRQFPPHCVVPKGLEKCPDSMTLASHLDSRLAPKERALLEEHLVHCPKCAKDVSELRELLTQVDAHDVHSDSVRELAERAKKLVSR